MSGHEGGYGGSPGHGTPGHGHGTPGHGTPGHGHEGGVEESADAAARTTDPPTNRRCTYPECGARIWADGERYCRPHHLEAKAWLKEERRRDLAGEPDDYELTYQPAEPGGPPYPWADWDWDSGFSFAPDEFGDWGEIV